MVPQVSPARRAQVVVILDHNIPAGSFQSAFRQKALIDFSRANSLEFIQSAGISYQLLMQGRLATGSLLVTCGQHVAQVGAIGALGLRFSPEELARWLQGGELTLPAPQPLHIRLEGDFAPGATAYDIALACAGKKGAEGRLLLLHFPYPGLHQLFRHQRLLRRPAAHTALRTVSERLSSVFPELLSGQLPVHLSSLPDCILQ